MTDLSDFDALSVVMDGLRVRAEAFHQGEHCGLWSLSPAGTGRTTFHVVGHGSGWLHLRSGAPPIPIGAGDLLLFIRDELHELSSGSDHATVPAQESPPTTLVCAFLDFGADLSHPVLAALPNILHLRAATIDDDGSIQHCIALLLRESQRGGTGSRSIVNKLLETLFVLCVRAHLRTQKNARGILAAMSDRRLARAIAAIHTDPARDWSLDALAEHAGMGRTAFASSFRERVGVPPVRYLTEQRMQAAADMLRNPESTVAEVADRLGYQTEAAFRRAFRRVRGLGPGQWRKEGRAGM